MKSTTSGSTVNSYVVDACVVVKWFFPESDSIQARSLLELPNGLHAPTFLQIELLHVLLKKYRRNEATFDEITDISNQSIFSIIDQFHDMERYTNHIRNLSIQLSHSPYDCIYLACAERTGFPLVTADRRFFSRVANSPHAEHILWLEDIPEVLTP